jgi:hypothetical protein
MNNKPDCHPDTPESGQQIIPMTEKQILLEARAIENEAYFLYLLANTFYHNIKNGFYGEALKKATRLKLNQTHPELYAALKAKAEHEQ